MIKTYLISSIILFTSISIGLFSFNGVFAEVDTDKSVYTKGEPITIFGNIDQLDVDKINILEIQIRDLDNNTIVNEYVPINDEDEFLITYDTITWQSGNYKATIIYNDIEESIEFEINSLSQSSENNNDDTNESSKPSGDNQQESNSQSSSNEIPNSPVDLMANVVSSTQIDLSWSLFNNMDTSITGFKIESRINTDPNYSVIVANTGSLDTIYSHTDLIPDTVYAYRVSAVNSFGESEPSSSRTVKTYNDDNSSFSSTSSDIENTDVPTDVQAKVISPTSVELSWNPPTQTYGQNIQGYTIKQEIFSDTYDEIASIIGSNTDYTISDLRTDMTYTFVVVANYLLGSSDISEEVTVTLTSNLDDANIDDDEFGNDDQASFGSPDDVPDSPVKLKVTPVSSSQMDLSWYAPENDSDNNKSIIGYKIEVRTINDPSYSTVVENTESTDTLFSHEDLIPNTTYIYRVSAINEYGISEPSSENLANTLITDPENSTIENNNNITQENNEPSSLPEDNTNDNGRTDNDFSSTSSNTLPSPPTNLQATQISQSRINLSWSAPVDGDTTSIIGYKIESKTSEKPNYSILVINTGSPSITTYSHTGLVPELTYFYRVSTITFAGESVPSDVSEVTITSTNDNVDRNELSQQNFNLQPLQVSVDTDKSVYDDDDAIEIFGKVNNSLETISLGLRVISSDNQIVYARSILLTDDKTFETTIIPSQRGSSSWQGGDGKFTVEITNNGRIQATTTFEHEITNITDGNGFLVSTPSEYDSNEQNTESSSPSILSKNDFVQSSNNELVTLRIQNNELSLTNQQLQEENNQFRSQVKELNERIDQLDVIIKEQIHVMLETLGIS